MRQTRARKAEVGEVGEEALLEEGSSKPDSSYLRIKMVTEAYFAVVDLCT